MEGPQLQLYAPVRLPGRHYPRQMGHTRLDLCNTCISQPFTTTDLLNWRQHTPAYSEEPQAVIELLTNIMHSNQPNWDDCHQLMSTFFTSDERRQVYQAARAWLITQALPQTANHSSGQIRESKTPDQTGTPTLQMGSNHPAHETSYPGGSPPRGKRGNQPYQDQ
jgi:hypothetical protein